MFDELKRFEADLRSDPKRLEKLDQSTLHGGGAGTG